MGRACASSGVVGLGSGLNSGLASELCELCILWGPALAGGCSVTIGASSDGNIGYGEYSVPFGVNTGYKQVGCVSGAVGVIGGAPWTDGVTSDITLCWAVFGGKYRERVENVNSSAAVSSVNDHINGPIQHKMAPLSQQKRRAAGPENILSLGFDPTLFNTVKPIPRSTSCHHCGLHGSRRCSQCRQTYYCSLECQREDWAAHSVICKPAAQKEQIFCKPPSDTGEKNTHSKVESPPVSNFKMDQNVMKKIRLSDLQERGLKEGMEIKGYVLDFTSPSKFFVQIFTTKSVESLRKLTVGLHVTYKSTQNIMQGYKPAVGEICVAKYSQDQNWYRVLVQAVDINLKTAQVLYIDYGNEETVKLDDLQQMHRDLELFPPAVIKCFVANVIAPPCAWTPECLLDVRKMLLGQQISCTIIQVLQEELPCYGVEVTVLGVHVNKLLLEKGYAFTKEEKSNIHNENHEMVKGPNIEFETFSGNPKQVEEEMIIQPQAKMWKAITVSVGDVFTAAVTEIQTPEEFFCQQVKNAKELAELLASMSEHYKVTPSSPGFSPAVGDICSAQFTEDKQWYRASIMEYVSDESVLVGYVDFGNLEVLPISSLRPILLSMQTLPIQAIKCSLTGVKPAFEKWSQEATSLFRTLVVNKILTVKVVGQKDGSVLVELLDGSVEPELVIARRLLEAKVAITEEAAKSKTLQEEEEKKRNIIDCLPVMWAELPIGHSVEVMVCMLYSPGEFYCQLCSETDLTSLNEMNTALGKHCLQDPTIKYIPKKGGVCCAFFSGDGNWYRAMVADINQNGTVTVHFLDYGNIEEVTVDKLRSIPPKFLELPFQTIQCCLAGVKPVGGKWDKESTQLFRKCVEGIKLQAQAVLKSKNGFHVVLVASDLKSTRVIGDVLIAKKAAVQDDIEMTGAVMGTVLSPVQKKAHEVNISPSSNADKATSPAKQTVVKDKMDPLDQKQVLSTNTSPAKTNVMCERLEAQEDTTACMAPRWISVELPLNEAVQARVLKVISPDQFYTFPIENRVDVEKLRQVMLEMGAYGHTEKGSNQFRPSVGDACCAKFSEDGQWYRAVVLDTSDSSVTVAYADYGNIERLPISSLLPIKESFLQPPVQVVLCSLADVAPVSDKWSTAATELLQSLVTGGDVAVTAVSQNCGIYSVSVKKLHELGVLCIDEKLVNEGLARPAKSPSSGNICKGSVCKAKRSGVSNTA
ncbi:tudor domain-containing protein 1 [Discoglossus pictus]